MAIRLWGSKTPGNAQDTRDITLMRNKKRVNIFSWPHSYYTYIIQLYGKSATNLLLITYKHSNTRKISIQFQVIKMLIIVVLLFGICWFPLQLYNILHVTYPNVNQYKYINIVWFCSDWLAMSNSCYNPFIYGIYNVNINYNIILKFSI